ncbi:MAG: AMP-binding protein, partial [Bacteroidota bacterium]
MPSLFQRANRHAQRIAVRQGSQAWEYETLLGDSGHLAYLLKNNQQALTGKRIAFLVSPGYGYIRTQWAIWQTGAIAVPLCIDHPFPALQFIIDDTE